jgi:hypothetical protein
MSDSEFIERFVFLKRLGVAAAVGVALLLVALALPDGGLQTWAAVLGCLAAVPACFYLVLLTAWHWKARYRGAHSDLWGAVLVIESSGWFKLVYLFRHLIPDAAGTGRYRRDSVERAA